jgi:hypothetical protein
MQPLLGHAGGDELRSISPGGAKPGHASLMRPNARSDVAVANVPLRRNPNDAAAIIAA